MTRQLFIIFILLSTLLSGQDEKIRLKKLEFIRAKYPGGKKALNDYLHQTVVRQIANRTNLPEKIDLKSWVDIDTTGKVFKVVLVNGSGFADIDSVFVDAVRKMPLWEPASNETGIKCRDKQTIFLKFR
jgi:hypothetical protein